MRAYRYKEMSDWLCEVESYGSRSERFYEDLKVMFNDNIDVHQYATLLKWMDAAFRSGREQLHEDEIGYDEKYDSHYNKNTKQWIEDPCDDEQCEYCKNRPESAE